MLQGDPVWAISSDTANSLVDLSLNFFLILPLMNSGMIRLYMVVVKDTPNIYPLYHMYYTLNMMCIHHNACGGKNKY